MKTSLFSIAFALTLPFAQPALADDEPIYSLIRTNSGKVYVNFRVYKTFPDSVIIEFKDGGARLLFSDLNPEFRAMLGYDPEKAAAFEKERAEKESKEKEEREELAKYQSEMARLQAAAFEAEAARYQYMSAQGVIGGYAGGGGYPYAGGYAWSYPYFTSGFFPSYSYGGRSEADCYGYAGFPNSPHDSNCGSHAGSVGHHNGYSAGTLAFGYGHSYGCGNGYGNGYGNHYGNGYGNRNGYGYGHGAYHYGPVARGGVPYRSNWNGSFGWNGGNGWHGHFGWNGNSFHGAGHSASARGFCGTPQLNGISIPRYSIPAPCLTPGAVPSIGRGGPAVGGRGRR